MTHPSTDQGVTAEDREAAASLIETYWAGGDAAMLKLAASYRAGHEQGAFVRAFRDHRLSSTAALEAEIAFLKQRLESAEGLLKTAYDAGIYLEPVAKGIATFLQEQEKQNG